MVNKTVFTAFTSYMYTIHTWKYCRWWWCWWNSCHTFLTLQLVKTKQKMLTERWKYFSQSKRLAKQVKTQLFSSDDLIKRLCHCILDVCVCTVDIQFKEGFIFFSLSVITIVSFIYFNLYAYTYIYIYKALETRYLSLIRPTQLLFICMN